MELTFKPGNAGDISILYGKEISDSPIQLVELCKTNKIQCEFSPKLPSNTIKFYIDPVRVRKQHQRKSTPYKARSQVFKLSPGLFSNVISKSNSQPTPSKPPIDTEKLILRLVIVYIHEEKVEDYFKEMSNFLSLKAEAGAKHIFLLEGIKSAVKERAIKARKKLFSRENAGEPVIATPVNPEQDNSEEEIKTIDDLEFKLMDMTSPTHWEYEYSMDADDSMKFLQKMVVGVVTSKYKPEAGEFDVKGQTHTTESNYAGINDVYSLMWIDMLMAVPGVSEKKAIAIYQHYPSLTKLMDAYEDQLDEESKIQMMADIQVSKTFDSNSKARNLGKALSSKIYAVFQSEKEKQFSKLLRVDELDYLNDP